MLTKPGDLTGSVITRGGVTYTEVERRGTTRIMQAIGNEPLPYAVFTTGRDLIARTEDRVTASWILDALEGKDGD